MSTLPVAVIAVPVPADVAAVLDTVCSARYVAPPEVGKHFADAEGLLCPAPFPVTNSLLDAAPHLRVVSNFGVGFNNVDLAEMERRNIAVCNTPGVLTGAVADLTIGMLLMASRQLVRSAAYVSGGAWSSGQPAPPLGFDLAGKLLGLVGFGRIGRAVAERARAFGLRIAFHDTFQSAGPGFEDCTWLPLGELLQAADFVSLHTNLTPETHHLIGNDELALMRPGAWLLNTARGPVIDQAALVEALENGQIAGAVLDVLETEPPPPGDPILSLANAILLPHVGSATVETRAAMLDLAVRNLAAVLSGQPPPECVNPGVLSHALQRR